MSGRRLGSRQGTLRLPLWPDMAHASLDESDLGQSMVWADGCVADRKADIWQMPPAVLALVCTLMNTVELCITCSSQLQESQSMPLRHCLIL